MVDEREQVAGPAAAVSAAVANVALRMREEALAKKRRPPQPAVRFRLARFWRAPRVVVRDALINDPRRFVLLISALVGSALLAAATPTEPSLATLMSLSVAVLVAAIFGIGCVYLRALLTGTVCRWLGGDVTNAETRTVLGWSWLPVAMLALLLLPRTLALIAMRMDAPPGLFPAIHDGGQVIVALYDQIAPVLAFAGFVAVLSALVLETLLLADAAGLRKWRAFVASSASSLLPVGALMVALMVAVLADVP